MDINKALRSVVTTGKVYFGLEQTKKALKAKKVKLIIVASNCPESYIAEYEKYDVKIPIYKFAGTNIELGTICGKQFGVSTLAVIHPGESNILALRSPPSPR